jgi:hypothetical protein
MKKWNVILSTGILFEVEADRMSYDGTGSLMFLVDFDDGRSAIAKMFARGFWHYVEEA